MFMYSSVEGLLRPRLSSSVAFIMVIMWFATFSASILLLGHELYHYIDLIFGIKNLQPFVVFVLHFQSIFASIRWINITGLSFQRAVSLPTNESLDELFFGHPLSKLNTFGLFFCRKWNLFLNNLNCWEGSVQIYIFLSKTVNAIDLIQCLFIYRL